MRHIRTFIFVATAWACFIGPAVAVDRLDEIFERGNEAFLEGNYEAAVAEYQRLIDLGIEDPDVHYNLGLSHVRSDRLGHAILAFERALHLDTASEDVRTALASTRTLLARRQADRDGEATVRSDTSILEAAFRSASLDGLAVTALVTWNITFLCLLVWRRGRREGLRLSAATVATLAGLLAAGSLLGTTVKGGLLSDGADAIYVASGGTLREGPDHRTAAQGTVQEGERCILLRTQGDYREVRCSSGNEGWCPADEVAPIGR